MRYAWVTITGKVYVPDFEMMGIYEEDEEKDEKASEHESDEKEDENH